MRDRAARLTCLTGLSSTPVSGLLSSGWAAESAARAAARTAATEAMAALKRQYEAPADEDGRGRTPPGGVKPWLLVAGVGVALVLLAAFDAGSAVSYRPAVRAAQVPLPAASKQGLGPRRHEPRPQCMTGASAQCPPAPAPEFSGARRWAADALPDHLAALDDAIARSTTMPSAAIDARELPTLSPAAAATASADPVAFAAQLEGFLEYGSRPFVALPAYWNTTVTAALRAELRRFQEAGCAEAGEGGDQRTFECERYSALAQRMRDDKLVAEVARKYLGMRPGAPFKRHTVLAGRVAYSPGRAVSSGGGWHRDKGACRAARGAWGWWGHRVRRAFVSDPPCALPAPPPPAHRSHRRVRSGRVANCRHFLG